MNGRLVADEVLQILSIGPARRQKLGSRSLTLRPRQISNGLYTLRRRGWARMGANDLWSLTEAGKEAMEQQIKINTGGAGQARSVRTPRKRSFRHRAWQALRRKGGKATIPDLLRVLDADTPGNADNLESYFRALESAGVLCRLKRKARGMVMTSPGHTVWVLSDDPGPKPLVWQKAKGQIFDHNTNTIYPLPPRSQAHD